jgi:hypothetical protein
MNQLHHPERADLHASIRSITHGSGCAESAFWLRQYRSVQSLGITRSSCQIESTITKLCMRTRCPASSCTKAMSYFQIRASMSWGVAFGGSPRSCLPRVLCRLVIAAVGALAEAMLGHHARQAFCHCWSPSGRRRCAPSQAESMSRSRGMPSRSLAAMTAAGTARRTGTAPGRRRRTAASRGR